MSGGRARGLSAVGWLVLVLFLASGACFLSRDETVEVGAAVDDPVRRPEPPPPSPEPPRFTLEVRLRRVEGHPIAGKVRRRRLVEPARAVRGTLAELYSVGFVERDRWKDGRFPSLFGFFAGAARRQARRDVKDLTLGPAARHLSAVRPDRARVDVRFLTNARRKPVVALAEMDFVGTGIAEGAELKIRHGGEYVLRRVDGAWRIVSYDVRGRVPPPRKLRRAMRATFVPPVLGRGGSLFILAIGSDARPGKPVERALADSLHIIGFNAKKGTASIVGIPRDSFVPIPGVGTRKINASLFYGGPELTVRTVERLTGITIDGYLLTGFGDFTRMVSDVGGVEVPIPYAMNDPKSHAHFRPGRKRLHGPGALAFSRNRYDAPGGDFGRSMNQGRLIIAALAEFRRDLRRDPVTLLRWLIAGARYVRTDLALEQMLELLILAASLEPGRVRNVVVSGSGGMVGGQSVVHLGGGAHATFRDLARDGMIGGR